MTHRLGAPASSSDRNSDGTALTPIATFPKGLSPFRKGTRGESAPTFEPMRMPPAAPSRPLGIPHRVALVLGSLAVGLALLLLVAHRASAATPDECQDLQGLIDATPSGGRLHVPACIYRQSVTIDRPMHLIAEPGTTIVGADLWTRWDGRISVDRVPEFVEHGRCEADRPGCLRPDRVILDGMILERVEADPGAGQYALDGERRVVLGEDPAGREVEVVVRREWVRIASSDVTLEGFAMRHAASPAQFGALQVEQGVSRFVLRDCDAGYASGAVVSIADANDSVIEGCDIHHGGQLGVHISGDEVNGRGNIVRDTIIRDNNTAGFDAEWEAGGLKATRQRDLVLTGNTVRDNRGPGLWCDIDCFSIEIVDNLVRDNTHAGIFFEISEGALIAENRVWSNGWAKPDWGWGAGILVSSAGGAEVRDNVVAWNAAGISVVSQDREDAPASITGIRVEDNLIVGENGRILLGWMQDWPGQLFDESAGNIGQGNRYWVPGATQSSARFEWAGDVRGLDGFTATPGEEGAEYLTPEEATEALAAAGAPVPPAPPPPADPIDAPPGPFALPVPALLGLLLAALLLVALGAAVIVRRRRARSQGQQAAGGASQG
jgi:nitrous oxidase accessory protein NosD